MEPAVAGLLGALIGGGAAIGAAFVASWLHGRSERRAWIRIRKAEAYAASIAHLLRAVNKRSEFTPEGVAVLGKDIIAEWVDEISDAQSSIAVLAVYCSQKVKGRIENAVTEMDNVTFHLLQAAAKAKAGYTESEASATLDKRPLPQVLLELYETVKSCAREDVGNLSV